MVLAGCESRGCSAWLVMDSCMGWHLLASQSLQCQLLCFSFKPTVMDASMWSLLNSSHRAKNGAHGAQSVGKPPWGPSAEEEGEWSGLNANPKILYFIESIKKTCWGGTSMVTWSQHQGRIKYTVTVQRALPSLAVKTSDASLGTPHCSPEKTAVTPTLNLCSLHPILLIVLAMEPGKCFHVLGGHSSHLHPCSQR